MQSHYKPDAIIALASAIREQANTFILNALAAEASQTFCRLTALS
ncbi:hypothetical protein [Desulfobulbus oralis]|nr:hypothetical protein [Desulfobulbus oralis]